MVKYNKTEFWSKVTTYYEQPTIEFENQYMMYVLQNEDSYFYSSVIKLNEYYDNVVPIPLVKVILSNPDRDH